MICYTALLVYRLIEAKLDDYGTHFTIDNIIDTLKNMGVLNSQDMFYQSTFNGSQVCTALNAVFGLELDKKYYLPKTLNKILKNILK
jgi:DNA topoisomerase IA